VVLVREDGLLKYLRAEGQVMHACAFQTFESALSTEAVSPSKHSAAKAVAFLRQVLQSSLSASSEERLSLFLFVGWVGGPNTLLLASASLSLPDTQLPHNNPQHSGLIVAASASGT
jgi:hypothetical protein